MTYPQTPVQIHAFTPSEKNWSICSWCGAGRQSPAHPATHAITHRGLTGGQHLMHLILDVLTAGLWIPFHILFALRGRNEVTRYSA